MLCRWLRHRFLYAFALGLTLVISVFYLASDVASSTVEYYGKSPIVSELNYTGVPHGHGANKSKDCEIIDVAIMLRGQESCNHGVLLIKSILLFRQSPIRLHLLVDSTARHVMGTLLTTWHLYGLEYHFYHTQQTPTHHWSIHHTVFHLLNSLPLSVERVIYTPPKVLISTEVYRFLETFRIMRQEGKVLGLYREPGLSGIMEETESELMLVDLKALRHTQGDVSGIAKTKVLGSLKPLSFCVLSRGCSEPNSSLMHSVHDSCNHRQTVCVHSSVGSSHYKTLIQDYDGNLLRERWINCQTGPTFDDNAIKYRAKTSVYDPPCTDFKREGNQERRTHPFYAGQWLNPHSSQSNDITILLHGSMDRLVPMLEPMCRHWEGPMSIAVFANDSEVSGLINLIQSSPVISSRSNIAYHIVYKEGEYYPSNLLRCTALQNVGTDYVFLNDMDFLPSFGLYSHLKRTVREFDLNHTVLVVPAFETYIASKTFVFPNDKSALIKLVSQKKVFQFHRDKYIRGHAPTDYPRWEKANEPYEIQWQPQYEPYLVASRNITPLDPRFVSRDFNKVSHVEQLYYQRYKFYVLPEGFLLHLPHQLSSDAMKQRTNERHSECYTRRRDEWRADMVQEYGYEPYLVNVYKIWNRLSSSYETSF